MKLSEIKKGFYDYYVKKLKSQGKSENEINLENFSIYSNIKEFKEYLNTENILDSSTLSRSLSDIISALNERDKSLLENNEEFADSDAYSDSDEQYDLMSDFLEDLFSQDVVVNSIDSDDNKFLDINEISDYLYGLTYKTENGEVSFEELSKSVRSMYLLEGILSDENAQMYLDFDSDNFVTDNEKENFKSMLLNKDGELISDELLQKVYDSIHEGTFSHEFLQNLLEGGMNGELNEIDSLTDDSNISHQSSDDNDDDKIDNASVYQTTSGGSYGSGGGYSSSLPEKQKSTDPLDNKTVDELKKIRDAKINDIKTTNANIENAYSNKDPYVSAAFEEKNKAEDNYLQLLENDENVNKELVAEEKQVCQDIDKTSQEISDFEAQIYQCDAQISIIDGNIAMKENEISSLESAKNTIESDDKKRYSKLSEIESRITSLQSEIESLKAEKDAQQTQKNTLEENKNTASEKLAELEQRKSELEYGNDSDIPVGILDSCSQETKDAYDAFQKSIDTFESVRSSRISKLKNELKVQQTDLEKIDYKLSQVQNNEDENEFSSTTQGEKIIEFAKQFIGKTSGQMSEIMRKLGYQFDTGAWCADFVSFCCGMILGEDNLPEWYKNCNRAYCPSITKYAKSSAQQVSTKDLQPGDVIMVGIGGTGNDHALIFAGWADEEHNRYYTIERSHVNGGDGVATRIRAVSWGEIGVAFRLSI